MLEIQKISAIFERFAEIEAKNNSPLYENWCRQIINDPDLLSLIQQIPINQPAPNLFFASVQYLTQKLNDPFINCFQYPEQANYEESFQQLKVFCITHHEELLHIFNTKFVQTNEVQRASYLYPIFAEIYEQLKKPLILIEIGTSAGILLNLDRFQYEILQDDVRSFGNPSSPMKIQAKNYGKPLPFAINFKVSKRYGIDLNIIDLQNEEDFLWLESLIWPEQLQRKENLKLVRAIHNQCEKELFEGDFLDILPKLLQTIDENVQIVIFHTHVANQFSTELKSDLVRLLETESAKQPIYHVYNNMYDHYLHVDIIKNSHSTTLKVLKHIDGHGKYYDWQ